MHFKLPIGDWSGDGHGKCDWFTVTTDAPHIDNVREDYFRINKTIGTNLEKSMCSGYKEGYVTIGGLKELSSTSGIDFLAIFDKHSDEEPFEDKYYMYPKLFAQLVVGLLNKIGDYEYVLETSIPMLPFYGFDEQKRHIDHIGYGCFD